MDSTILDFVLQSVKPKRLDDAYIAAPPFLTDSRKWTEALDCAERLQCSLPTVVTMDRVPWRSEIPEAIQLRMDERLQRERMILAILDHELDCALFLLIGAGIPVLVVGGMDLGRRFYPDRILRPVSVIRLVVPKEKYFDALRILGRGGYRASDPVTEKSEFSSLSRSEGGPLLELHSTLIPGDTSHFMGVVWNQVVENTLSGLPEHVCVLKNEDCFLYLVRLCVTRYFLQSPVWLNDIHYLIESAAFKQNSDWDQITWSLAHDRAITGAWFVMNFLKQNWGTDVPKEALQSLGHKVGPIAKTMCHAFSQPSSWFQLRPKTMPTLLRSYLLGGSAIRALQSGIARGSSKERTI